MANSYEEEIRKLVIEESKVMPALMLVSTMQKVAKLALAEGARIQKEKDNREILELKNERRQLLQDNETIKRQERERVEKVVREMIEKLNIRIDNGGVVAQMQKKTLEELLSRIEKKEVAE